MDRSMRDFVAANRWLQLRRSNCETCGIGAWPASQRHGTVLFDMINDGLRQAQFTGGGQVANLVAIFDNIHGRDAAPVLEDDGVRHRLSVNEE